MTDLKSYRFERAIIIGGSIGGLLASHVLSKYFKQVIVIESDTQAEVNKPTPRNGVPQGGNGHLITVKGVNILLEFFPELAYIFGRSGIKKIDMLEHSHIYLGDWMPVFESKLYGYYLSRPYLELCIRSLLKDMSNIRFIYGARVQKLLTNTERTSIKGVTVKEGDREYDLEADLIIDVSGRQTSFLQWLAKLGYNDIALTKVKTEVFYASYIYLIPEESLLEWDAIIIGTGFKHGSRYGGLWKIENDEQGRQRWQVNLIAHGVQPGRDPNDFSEFAKTLLVPDIYAVIKDLTPELKTFNSFKFSGSIRKNYEKAKSLPDGFIVIGDAFCALNPIYGHGMTVCCLEAKLLDQLLSENITLRKLQPVYFKKASPLIDLAWNISTFGDFVYPDTEGEPPLFFHQINSYRNYVYKASVRDPIIWLYLYKTIQLLTPPTIIFHPRVLLKVSTLYLLQIIKKIKNFILRREDIEMKNIQIVKLLKNIDLFKSTSDSELVKLYNSAKKVQYKPGKFIIKEGDKGSSFYIIDSGSLRVITHNSLGEEIVLARLEAGNYFGEFSILDEQAQRNASVIAITQVKLLEIPRSKIISLLQTKKLKFELERRSKYQLLYKLAKKSFTMGAITSKLSELPVVTFADKQTIFRKGDMVDNVYLIISGIVAIYLEETKETKDIIKLESGQIFGEVAVLQNKLRLGTAVAEGQVKAICINAELFQKLYKINPHLKTLTNAMQRSYQIPRRGTVTVKMGNIFDLEAVNSIFKLNDGREITAYQLLDKNGFIMSCSNAPIMQSIAYKSGEIYREIAVDQNKITHILSYGTWDELGYACGLMLDDLPLTSWQISLFQETGSFGSTMSSNPDAILCFCTQKTYGQIMEAILSGYSNFENLLEKTGAGKICGSCKPQIMEMLGVSAWLPVYIHEVKRLTPEVHSYQLKPYKEDIKSYKAGQHIVIQALIDKHWINRTYTLTSIADNDYYEITVKKEQPKGYFSNWLFENEENKILIRLSAPQGDFTIDLLTQRPAIFFAAGIGVTPALAFARLLMSQQSNRRFHIDYSAHSRNQFIYLEELNLITKNYPNFTFNLRVTSEVGRITEEEIKKIVQDFPEGEFYVCGPDGYRKSLISILESLNILDIHSERFTPAGGLI